MVQKKRNEDGTYGPVCRSDGSEAYYRPQPYHNKNSAKRKDKELWCIKENEQFKVFYLAAEDKQTPIWFCNENKSLFSIIEDGKKVLGLNGERLGKFKLPSNETDPWHGYPIEAKTKWNTPSDSLLDIWENNDVISEITRRRIERSKI